MVPGPPPAGYLAASPVAVDLDAGADIVVDLTYEPAGSIAGRVLADDDGVEDASTQPLAGVRLTLYRDDGNGAFDPSADTSVATTISDGDGAFAFDGVGAGGHFVLADLGDGLIGTLTTIRSANPVGPVSAGATDVVFIADPIDLTLPETGNESRGLLGLGLVLVVAGGLLHLLAVGRRRTPDASPA